MFFKSKFRQIAKIVSSRAKTHMYDGGSEGVRVLWRKGGKMRAAAVAQVREARVIRASWKTIMSERRKCEIV